MHDRKPIQIQMSATLFQQYQHSVPDAAVMSSPSSVSKPIAIPSASSQPKSQTQSQSGGPSGSASCSSSFMYSIPSAASSLSLASAIAASASVSASATAQHYHPHQYQYQACTPPKSPTYPVHLAFAQPSAINPNAIAHQLTDPIAPPYQSPPESPTVPLGFSSPSSWTSALYFSSTPHMRRMSAPLTTVPTTFGTSAAGTAPPPGMTGSAGVVGALSSAAAAMASASASAPTSPDILVLGNARRRVQSLSAVTSPSAGAATVGVASSPPLSAPLTSVPESPQRCPEATNGALLSRGRSLSSATSRTAQGATASAAKKTKKQRPTSPMRQFILSGHSLDAL